MGAIPTPIPDKPSWMSDDEYREQCRLLQEQNREFIKVLGSPWQQFLNLFFAK